ncbi:hypothetical protein BsWGS_25607 [Bradybaena similaris]
MTQSSTNGEQLSPSMLASYTVEVPEPQTQSGVYPIWLDREVQQRIQEYDPGNPLGISAYLDWVVLIYVPVLVVVAGALNVFAVCVLQSSFLRDLVIQPLLQALLCLNILTLLLGPLYAWLVQCLGVHLDRQQLYPCFLLLWGHNFATIANSGIVVAMILERALSLGKPEILWDLWRKACRNTASLVVFAALVLAVGGLMCVDSTMEHSRLRYPICLPWWDNEHGSVSPLWNKIVAFNFSLGPSMMIWLAMVLLILSLARFKKMLQSGVKTLNHYNALYLEVRSTLHLKFVKSVWWLGSFYTITSLPLGCFIIFGPAIYTGVDGLDFSFRKVAVFAAVNSENSSAEARAVNSMTYSILSPLDYNYLLISRLDTETLLWMMYYSFTLFTVPVLLSTEVLFRREWSGLYRKIIRTLLGKRRKSARLLDFSAFEADEDLYGPYIARDHTKVVLQNGVMVSTKTSDIQIYDVRRALRAGRTLNLETCV